MLRVLGSQVRGWRQEGRGGGPGGGVRPGTCHQGQRPAENLRIYSKCRKALQSFEQGNNAV